MNEMKHGNGKETHTLSAVYYLQVKVKGCRIETVTTPDLDLQVEGSRQGMCLPR